MTKKLRITGEVYGRKFERVLNGTSDFSSPTIWQDIYREAWPCDPERKQFEGPLNIDVNHMEPIEE